MSDRASKRRKLSPSSDRTNLPHIIKSSDLFHHAAEWDLEQTYEQRPRLKKQKEGTRLPIKTSEGRIQHQHQEAPGDVDSGTDSDSAAESDRELSSTPLTDDNVEDSTVSVREQITTAKEELARLASLVNEDPEAHVGTLKKLASVAGSARHPTVKKLALATQLSVYKDLIPGYRLRTYKDDELGNKVSKDVRQTRQYEHALISAYRLYIEDLAAASKGGQKEDDGSVKTVAINCTYSLLLTAPHFNFRSELLKIVVGQLSARRYTEDFEKCIQTIETLFGEDDEGAISLEAVSALTKMMKTKDYDIQEAVVDTFLSLRLLSELPAKGSTTRADKLEEAPMYRGKKRKPQWEPRSKRERKVVKDRKRVEKDMKEADAVVRHEDRDRMQSDTLKMVFTTYFRILKLRSPHLTGAVLEGLAKYSHLINQDFFGDLLEALKEIVGTAINSADSEDEDLEEDPGQHYTSPDIVREALLSTQTAYALLSGQEVAKSASTLSLDLSFFTAHTFRSLYPLCMEPDIELGQRSALQQDLDNSSSNPLSKRKRARVNVTSPMLLLNRVLNSVLLNPSAPPPSLTVLAFYKRLLSSSLQMPEKSLLASLSILYKTSQKHSRKVEPLWHSDERKGDGNFCGESDSMEGSKVLALGSGVWETELLRCHFSPKVRKEVAEIDKVIKAMSK